MILNCFAPGTLIFDPVLKICNWPDSTTCISDLIVRPSRPKKISPGFGSSGDKVQDPGSSQFSKDILHALQRAATEKPVIVNVTPANKLSKRILSLFAAKDRKRNNRIKTNTFSNKNSDIKSRISAFRDGQGRRDSNRPSYSFDTTTQSPSTSSSTKFIRNKSFTTTTRRTSTTTKRTTTTESPRVKIRPFALRQRQNPFKSKEDGRIDEKRDSIKNVVRQAPYDSYEKVTEKVDSVTEADDEVVTKVRSESSVSSITSSVRVSVGDLAFLNSGIFSVTKATIITNVRSFVHQSVTKTSPHHSSFVLHFLTFKLFSLFSCKSDSSITKVCLSTILPIDQLFNLLWRLLSQLAFKLC